MIEQATSKNGEEAVPEGWPINELWAKYEDITMHFNDLLMKLRTQALAAVAALSAIVSIFAKSGADPTINWKMVAFVFVILCLFWIAIWILDFCYYNRLLFGAVRALLDIEEASKNKLRICHIDISTKIERAVAGEIPVDNKRADSVMRGQWTFYIIVFVALIGGFSYSVYEYANSPRISELPTKSSECQPRPSSSGGGWKGSAFGDTNQHGPEGVRFYTKIKTVTSRWPAGIRAGADFSIPTFK